MSGAPPSQHIGRTLGGQYRVDALLGYGGMGAVYRGVQLSVQRAVAIKLMSTGHTNPEQTYQRFKREAEATARLAHPNTVRVFDFGVTDTHELYMVMELLEGCDLSARLKRGPLPLTEALGVVRQVMLALCEAHALGIVHRDLKPGNVFLSRVHGGESFVKVMDFGIAGIAPGHEGEKLTVTGAVLGTPAYMSPEQAQGKGVDARSDLYSMGVMLFEMLTGQPPFEADTLVSMLLAHVTQPPKRLLDCGLDVPEVASVQTLLDRLLAKQPAERPASATEVVQYVDALLAGTHAALPIHPASAPPAPHQTLPFTPHQWDRTRARDTPHRKTGLWTTVGVAALAGLATGAAYWVVRKPASAPNVVTPAAPPPLAAAPPPADVREEVPVLKDGAETPATDRGEPAPPSDPAQAPAAAPSGDAQRASVQGAPPETDNDRRTQGRQPRTVKGQAHKARKSPSERAEPEPQPEPEPLPAKPSTRDTPATPRLDLNRAPPYPSMAAAKKALDGGKINAAAYEAAITLLKARRTHRLALERENLQKGQITPQEYEWRLGRIDAEYRGE